MTTRYFEHLFQPIQVGPMNLRNRIVMPPMSTNLGDPKNPGFVSERHKSYYGERARGGTALVIIESTSVSPLGRSRKFGLTLGVDESIPGFEELVGLIRACGAKCAIQLNHGGRIGPLKVDFDGNPDRSSLNTGQYFAASPLPHPMTGRVPQQLSSEQLEEITGYFVEAAKRAKKAGFDAIELHGAHGYILSEFLSPYTNKRTDRYGGDIEGRSRFPLQVVRGIKEAVGDDIALSYRMSVVEFVPGGLDINDSTIFAKELEKAGVQIIHVSGGVVGTPSGLNRIVPPMSYPRGALIDYAEQIKREVRIPVIAVQRINTPELAEEVIRDGKADLVATGRALISDPHWPVKAQEGRLDEIRRCIGCNQGCMERIIMEYSLTCLHNPEVGYESISGLGRKAKRRKKALVVGGGLAGMEAAYVLATRGHEVMLIEKEDRLGGTGRVASVLAEKKEFCGVIDYLENQLKKMSVEIQLKANLDIKSLEENSFDEIIIATGGIPITPEFKLHTKKFQVKLAKDVLMNPEGIGKDIFILGGGSVGIEVAEYLHHSGKNVTVFEMLEKICSDLGPLNRPNVLGRISNSSIKIMLNTKVLELNDEYLIAVKGGKEERIPPPDTVVIAMGAKPNPLSFPISRGRVHYVGDCNKVGNAMDAIHDSFNVAVKL